LTFQNDKDIKIKRDVSPDISRAKVTAAAPFLYQEGWSFLVLFLLKTVRLRGVLKLT
jgi:hypothetical protein